MDNSQGSFSSSIYPRPTSDRGSLLSTRLFCSVSPQHSKFHLTTSFDSLIIRFIQHTRSQRNSKCHFKSRPDFSAAENCPRRRANSALVHQVLSLCPASKPANFSAKNFPASYHRFLSGSVQLFTNYNRLQTLSSTVPFQEYANLNNAKCNAGRVNPD